MKYQFGDRVVYCGGRDDLLDQRFSFLRYTEDGKRAFIACVSNPNLDVEVAVEDIRSPGLTIDLLTEAPMHPAPAVGYVDGNPKTAAGHRKPTSRAIPPAALFALGMAMRLGEEKYGLFNWREHPITASTYLDAAERHMLEFRDGITFDLESGVIQLGHVMACCAIIIDAMANGTCNDDRTKFVGAASRLIEAISKGEPNAVCIPR